MSLKNLEILTRKRKGIGFQNGWVCNWSSNHLMKLFIIFNLISFTLIKTIGLKQNQDLKFRDQRS